MCPSFSSVGPLSSMLATHTTRPSPRTAPRGSSPPSPRFTIKPSRRSNRHRRQRRHRTRSSLPSLRTNPHQRPLPCTTSPVPRRPLLPRRPQRRSTFSLTRPSRPPRTPLSLPPPLLQTPTPAASPQHMHPRSSPPSRRLGALDRQVKDSARPTTRPLSARRNFSNSSSLRLTPSPHTDSPPQRPPPHCITTQTHRRPSSSSRRSSSVNSTASSRKSTRSSARRPFLRRAPLPRLSLRRTRPFH